MAAGGGERREMAKQLATVEGERGKQHCFKSIVPQKGKGVEALVKLQLWVCRDICLLQLGLWISCVS